MHEVESHFSREQQISEKVISFPYVYFLAVGFPMLLSVEVQTGNILPLMTFCADIDRGHLQDPDAMVGRPHQRDGVYTLYISTSLQIGLLPLGHKATRQLFQCGFHLCH